MVITRFLAVVFIVGLCDACSWIPKVEQQDFCSAHYVFEAEILERKSEDEMIGYVYDIRVKGVFRNKDNQVDVKGFKTIQGEGRGSSCGPQLLDVYSSYILYVDDIEGELRIFKYEKMMFVEKPDIIRMTRMYDCSCEIRMNNYPSFSGISSFESFPPTANQCDVPSAYCIRSFFCKRNSEGMCTSGNLGPCSY
ncbi:uncharacterized protein LOC128162369 [Crassostrea angulata]|uniref:uncharacterized protein LOC128162369 n=1 Tax=Magallana angulata TaxID=2784310 RepID=UPI0022B1B026|nr:uncharacterized protein LOC128162369 [Crassostrea angulata]